MVDGGWRAGLHLRRWTVARRFEAHQTLPCGGSIMSESRKREPWNPLLKSYPESEKINSVSIGAETMYTRLIAKADDYGNYYGNPSLVLAYLFGHRFAAGTVSGADTGRWRDELETVGLLTRYEVGTQVYLHVVNPHRRFRGDVKPDEQFPREPDGANIVDKAIPEHGTNTGRTRDARPRPRPRQDQDKNKKCGQLLF